MDAYRQVEVSLRGIASATLSRPLSQRLRGGQQSQHCHEARGPFGDFATQHFSAPPPGGTIARLCKASFRLCVLADFGGASLEASHSNWPPGGNACANSMKRACDSRSEGWFVGTLGFRVNLHWHSRLIDASICLLFTSCRDVARQMAVVSRPGCSSREHHARRFRPRGKPWSTLSQIGARPNHTRAGLTNSHSLCQTRRGQ
jgi:hypothetical protein